MVLDGDDDTFMRIDSKFDKWLIVELSQVVLPDTLQARVSCFTLINLLPSRACPNGLEAWASYCTLSSHD